MVAKKPLRNLRILNMKNHQKKSKIEKIKKSNLMEFKKHPKIDKTLF